MIVVHLNISLDLDLICQHPVMMAITLCVRVRLRRFGRPGRGRESRSIWVLWWTKVLPLLVWRLFAMGHIPLFAAPLFAPRKVVRPQLLDVEGFEGRDRRGDDPGQIFHRAPDSQIDDHPAKVGQPPSLENFHGYDGTHYGADTTEVAQAHQYTNPNFSLL